MCKALNFIWREPEPSRLLDYSNLLIIVLGIFLSSRKNSNQRIEKFPASLRAPKYKMKKILHMLRESKLNKMEEEKCAN
jgi:hypothetical protein